jgi:RecB family endonuclease NucS
MIEERPSKRVRTMTRIVAYEKELKALVRKNLHKVEKGLVSVDEGRERVVASGKIDITARDANGHFVVIELKAGPCPVGAIEQVLAYSHDLEVETGTPCRAVLVASGFSDRLRSAAKRAHELYLVTYEVDDMAFAEAVPPQHRRHSAPSVHLPERPS